MEELSWPLSLPHLLNQLPPPQKLTTRRDHEHEHVHKLHIRGMGTSIHAVPMYMVMVGFLVLERYRLNRQCSLKRYSLTP